MTARAFPRVDVLGVPVAATSLDEALALLAACVARREPAVFACANAHSLVLAGDDPEQRARLNRATYVMADGMPVVWLLRSARVRAERVHGDDLLLAACAAHPEWGHFVLGGVEGQPERAAAELARRVPGIRIVGCRATPRRPVPEDEARGIVDQIRRCGADMVWVGMGTPAQDVWMDTWSTEVGVPMAGCGSAFDLLAGVTREAPGWLKRSGLQWLFRLLQDPRRLGPRYLRSNPLFAARSVRALVAGDVTLRELG